MTAAEHRELALSILETAEPEPHRMAELAAAQVYSTLALEATVAAVLEHLTNRTVPLGGM